LLQCNWAHSLGAMALDHALLVALRERPGSGYELARRFDRSIGFFWTATHQQIYRVLRRMQELGWVRAEVVPQDARPDKKVYEVTPAGAAELQRWIAEPVEPEPVRLALGVKVRAAAFGNAKALREEVARQRDRHAQRLDLFQQIEKRDFPDPRRLGPQASAQYLVLRGGIMVEKGWVDWCEEAIGVLREMEAGQ
jgi:DNA-binding PadR family transcriptional regulator